MESVKIEGKFGDLKDALNLCDEQINVLEKFIKDHPNLTEQECSLIQYEIEEQKKVKQRIESYM
jgi:hypothetical protein